MTSTLFCGGEDLDFQFIGAALQTSPTAGNWAIDTTDGYFIPGFSRHALTLITEGNGFVENPVGATAYIRNISSFTASTFWCTARHVAVAYTSNLGFSSNPLYPIRWADASGIVRLHIKLATSQPTTTFTVETVDHTGATTQIGSASTVNFANFGNNGSPDKLDFYVNYGVSGEVTVYLNRVLILDVTGNLTTDGNSSLSYFDLGQTSATTTNTVEYGVSWSQIIVSSGDTRNQSLITRFPTGLGNTDQWSSNIIDNTINLGALSSSSSHSADTVIYAFFTASNGGTLSSIAFNLNTGFTGNSQTAIYTDNGTGSVPVSLLGTSSVITNPGSGANVYTFGSGPVLEAGTSYWAAFWANATYDLNCSSSSISNVNIQTGASSLPSVAATAFLNQNTPNINIIVSEQAVAALLASDNLPDSSDTSDQIQEYTVQNLPTGSFAIVDVTQVVRSAVGVSGPTNIQLGARISGTEYFSGDVAPAPGWERIAYTTSVNPATSASYTVSDLDNASYNIAIKSQP